MTSVRRRLFASVFVVLASVSFAGSVCDGWQASAMERMACCEDEDHPCTQVMADACCGIGEQRQHGTTPLPAPLAGSPLIPCAFASITPAPDRRALSLHLTSLRVLGSPPDTHLLLSVFLI